MTPTTGTVRARLVHLEVRPGAPQDNTDRMLSHIAAARSAGIQLLVFPELAVPGCLLGDEWDRPAFLRECETCGAELVAASDGLVLVFGNVAVDWQRRNEDGRARKYNALFIAEDRRLLAPEGCERAFCVKTLQPNYRAFDDDRHFYDARKLAAEEGRPLEALLAPVRTTRAGRIGGLLCEDAWDSDYSFSPGRILAARGADLLVVASSSPFTRGKQSKRHRVCSALARATQRPLLYVNAVSVQDIGKTVYTFDGGSAIYDGQGGVVEAAPDFAEGALTLDVPLDHGHFGRNCSQEGDGVDRVAKSMLYGIPVLMQRLQIRRVVVGISGGIDSAVAAALYGRILAPEDLLLVSMPGPYTSPITGGLARALAGSLGARYAELPIGASVELTHAQFAALVSEGPDGGTRGQWTLSGAALENVQARDRGSRLLAAAAAAFGGVISCNANKSEITVGYGTLYGDILGWLACIGDLWKGEVFELGRHLNEAIYGHEVIPSGTFGLTPSAELSAAQAVEKGLGDPFVYPYHDKLFRAWVERWERVSPEETLGWYLDGVLEREIGYEGCVAEIFPDTASFVADMERWWSLHQGLAIAKRLQAPPVLAVSRRAFGFDLREAQLGPRYTSRYLKLKQQALGQGQR
ncbi:MAG: NAD(+) synthase [Kiritimatiellae bacterium]|nr:NAD(+) synthase [Kiritimatiellia bacterium]